MNLARRSTKVSPMPIEEMEKHEKSLSKSRTSRKSSDDDKPIEKIKLTEGVVQVRSFTEEHGKEIFLGLHKPREVDQQT